MAEINSSSTISVASVIPTASPVTTPKMSNLVNVVSTSNKATFSDVRVCVVGNVDSGKSTLIGVLTGGVLDNGRGLARSRVFLHSHEQKTGRTSAIGHHILGFTEQNAPVHCTASASASSAQKNKAWGAVVSSSQRVVTFIDLAGHEQFLKTTVAGLAGTYPHLALVIVNSLAGITKMTREHMGVLLALGIPFAVVVSKVDMAPAPVMERTKSQIIKILKSPHANKLPFVCKDAKDVATATADESNKLAPIFFVSATTGKSIDLLNLYLATFVPRRSAIATAGADEKKDQQAISVFVPALSSVVPAPAVGKLAPIQEEKEVVDEKKALRHEEKKVDPDEKTNEEPTLAQKCEFTIDEIFQVSGVGVVVSGTVISGLLKENTVMQLGPLEGGRFQEVLVKTLHKKRVPVSSCLAGDSCAVSIKPYKRQEVRRSAIRRGMVLVDSSSVPSPVVCFEAEVLVLHHPTTISKKYQAVVHAGVIRQSAQIEDMSQEHLRTGDKAVVRFKFLQRPELLHEGQVIIFREGGTKGIGRVRRLLPGIPLSELKEPVSERCKKHLETPKLPKMEKDQKEKIERPKSGNRPASKKQAQKPDQKSAVLELPK